MKILVFDDKPDVNYFIKEYFENEMYDIISCTNCSDVKKILNEDIFDCYIVDLSAAGFGLEEEIRRKTQGGLLTGWFLLTEYIWKNDLDSINKTIIFSDYITQLNRYIDSDNASHDEKDKFNQLVKNKSTIFKSEGLPALKKAILLINEKRLL